MTYNSNVGRGSCDSFRHGVLSESLSNCCASRRQVRVGWRSEQMLAGEIAYSLHVFLKWDIIYAVQTRAG